MFGSQQESAWAVFFSYVSCFGRIVRCERSRQPLQPLALSSARVRGPAPHLSTFTTMVYAVALLLRTIRTHGPR
jgi:hypothetical protein